MDSKPYVKQLETLFEAHSDSANAVKMKQYMRNQFDFYGVKSPLRKELLKPKK